ncbi:MAG: trigger factor [Nevskia sp.]|nr:trigger factor [Nevskia sp.]
MEVHVESAGGLARRLHVKIPYERLQQELDTRLKRLAARARVPGFRPGKAPLKLIQQQYGASVRQDAIDELVRESWPQALEQAQVRPAGAPSIEIVEGQAGEPFRYVAHFDVFPEVRLEHLDRIEVKKPRVEITEADVERLIESLRRARRSLETVTRPARVGDVATVDFEGRIEGQTFPGGTGDKVDIEIGERRFLPELEDTLLGRTPGERFTADIRFPEDYRAEDLRGKLARFEITLVALKEPKLPAPDDAEFLAAHGVEAGAGLAGLQAKCRSALEAERDKALRAYLKRQVLEQLLAAHPVEVPASQIEQEIARLREETASRMQLSRAGRLKPEKLQQLLPDTLFEEAARRRVALGLLMREVIRSRGIQPDHARVERALDELAADYEHPETVKQFYRSRPELMRGLEAGVLEEQVVESLLQEAKSSEVAMTLEDLLKSQAQPAA